MSAELVRGDPGSCSRLGGTLRREAARLSERRRALAQAESELATWQGSAADAVTGRVQAQLHALAATAQRLDEAGAAVQRYATELADAHEQARRVLVRVRDDGLDVVEGRVREPWGPATSEEADRRRALLPEAQARVDRVVTQLGRARHTLQRTAADLTEALAAHSRALRTMPPGS